MIIFIKGLFSVLNIMSYQILILRTKIAIETTIMALEI